MRKTFIEFYLDAVTKGKSGGGGPTIESKNITENGTYQESGKAYSPVTVDVAPKLQQRNVTVTDNGTTVIKKTSSAYDGISQVNLTVDVKGGGGGGNIDFGTFDTGSMQSGVNNLFALRQNETPKAIYFYNEDPATAQISHAFNIVSSDAIADEHSGVPFDCRISITYYNGLQSNYMASTNYGNLESLQATEIGFAVQNGYVVGRVLDPNSGTGPGVSGNYSYVVIYPNT